MILVDRGDFGSKHQIGLFESVNIRLETPMRKNQKGYNKQPYIFRNSRKRVETLFSQLCYQFKIRNNYVNFFEWFKTRIISKITIFTIFQYSNKYEYNGILII